MKPRVAAAMISRLAAIAGFQPPQETSSQGSDIELFLALAKNPKDETVLKTLYGRDPGQFTGLLKLASDKLPPAEYCCLAKLLDGAMRVSLHDAIEDLKKALGEKRAEWKKDKGLFQRHTQLLLARANYLADLSVLYSRPSTPLEKLSEVLAIETKPHPVHLYAILAQGKLCSAPQRLGLAEYALKYLDDAQGNPEMTGKLKECNVEDLRSSFVEWIR